MLFDAFDGLNWLAVIVAAIAYFAVGGIWYSNALFGKQWREVTGASMGESGPDPKLLIGNLIAWIVAALALALVAGEAGSDTFGGGLVLGLVTGVGLVGTHVAVTNMYEERPRPLLWLSGGPMIIGFVIMGVIVSVWD